MQQDIVSQASVLDSDERKGQVLQSAQVNAQMAQTRTAYDSLLARIKVSFLIQVFYFYVIRLP